MLSPFKLNVDVRKLAAVLAMAGAALAAWAGDDTGNQNSQFTNRGSVANTRHNMTQSTMQNGQGGLMDSQRNNYQEVCVYCHTPHGANRQAPVNTLPLWNRTYVATTYNLYSSATLTQPVTQPGPRSLACLSCHDGQVGIDSVINMPGSGKYSAAQETSQSNAFLNTWDGVNRTHVGLTAPDQGCLVCHNPAGAGAAFPTAADFTVFAIGTDLSNDHPVGVTYPQPVTGTDFNDPTVKVSGRYAFFDDGIVGPGNNRPDKDEIRMYVSDGGADAYEVECASCHDPHGVPSAGAGSTFFKTFLRKNNAGSALCLTCHIK